MKKTSRASGELVSDKFAVLSGEFDNKGKPVYVAKMSKRYVSEGYDYNQSIRNKIAKEGGNPDDWKPQATWNRPVQFEKDGKMVDSKLIYEYCGKDEKLLGTRYLNYSYQNANGEYQQDEYFDGKGHLDIEQVTDLKNNFFDIQGPSKKQVEAGISEAETLIINRITLCNVLVLKMNKVTYIRKGYEG